MSNTFGKSFFPTTAKEWNALPSDIISSNSIESFKKIKQISDRPLVDTPPCALAWCAPKAKRIICQLCNRKRNWPSLEGADRVVVEVTHVNGLPLRLHFGVLPHEQPAHVREEETSLRIVGISVRFWVLVMRPVVTWPLDDVILKDSIVSSQSGPAIPLFVNEDLSRFPATETRESRVKNIKSVSQEINVGTDDGVGG